MRCTLLIDPSTLSSAQLKIMSFRLKRIITNPKVRKAMLRVEAAFRPYAHLARKVQESAPFGAVALGVKYYFPFPKTGTKKEKAARFGGQPCVSALYGDLDNRNKAVQDAIVKAGAFPDDRFITTLLLRKRYTLSTPRIEVAVTADLGGYDDEPFSLAEKPENAVPDGLDA